MFEEKEGDNMKGPDCSPETWDCTNISNGKLRINAPAREKKIIYLGKLLITERHINECFLIHEPKRPN